MTWPFAPLVPLSYDVIVADPPWSFVLYSDKGNQKSAAAQYQTMPRVDIEKLPVGRLAQRDCMLLLWSTAPQLQSALDAMRRWGFMYKTNLAWRKVTANGKVRMGTGYRARTMHETVLLGTIGNPHSKALPSLFDGVAREHSRKPDEFYDLVLKCTPRLLRRADLFSRETRPGFDGWGDEHDKFDSVASSSCSSAVTTLGRASEMCTRGPDEAQSRSERREG